MNEEEKLNLENDEEKVEGEVLPQEGESIELNSSPKVDEPVDEPVECGEANLDPVTEPELTDEQQAVEKMLSQKQVDDIVGRTRVETRDKTLRSIFERYGVEDEAGLDEIVGNGQRFPMLEEEMNTSKKESGDRITELEKQLGDLSTELALFKSEINPDRYEDVKLILKGKGLDINNENIANEMSTHPEWKKVAVEEKFTKTEPEEPVSKFTRLGNEQTNPVGEKEAEENTAMKLFNIRGR